MVHNERLPEDVRHDAMRGIVLAPDADDMTPTSLSKDTTGTYIAVFLLYGTDTEEGVLGA